MKACFVSSSSLNEFWQNSLEKIENPELLVFGYNGLGLVSYKDELAGITEYFQDVAKLSKQLGCTLISACDTDTYGVKRHSAVIADKGKILGVTDMTHSIDESEYVSGGTFRVYDTGAGKIGIIIGEDLYFPEVSRILTLCDADIVVVLFKKVNNSMPVVMLRANAFANGVTMTLCADKYVDVADIRGNIALASSKDIVEMDIKPEKDYHLISSRRRGIYRDFVGGY